MGKGRRGEGKKEGKRTKRLSSIKTIKKKHK